RVGYVTTHGDIVEFPVLTHFSGPHSIVAGPDGAMWFTENAAGQIGRVTTWGLLTEYATPTRDSVPGAITLGPDGDVWFVELGTGTLGHCSSTRGTIVDVPLPGTAGADPAGITRGPDGKLWVTLATANAVAAVRP